MTTLNTFQQLMSEPSGKIAGKPLDDSLDAFLNREFPPGGETFDAIESTQS